MPKKLKARFTISIRNVLERIKNYPNISKVIQTQLDNLSNFKEPPLIEQVHKVIYWLHEFSDWGKELLDELELVVARVEGYEFCGKENLLSNFGTAKDYSNFSSAYSELFLTNFFIKNGIELIQYEPIAKDGKYKADFKICLGVGNNVMVELVTPGERSSDFARKSAFLFEKLERVQSGLSIEVSGFESYDSSDLWRTKVEPPTPKQIEEIITNFRKYAYNISDPELPKELPTLCQDYPRIRITVHRKIPSYEGTFVALSASRTAEGFPGRRIIKLILHEKEHLSPEDCNLIFVDFSNWSRIEWGFLRAEYYRKLLIEELKKNISSRVDGVLTYMLSNKEDEKLINRRILCLNSNKPCLSTPEARSFLKCWKGSNQ